MARMPDQVVERLKSDISVARLAEARGVVLERRGADLHGRCPFHEGRTASLIDWVMRAEGVSFRHAVELLQNDYGPTSSQRRSSERRGMRVC
jgi:DNA primase